MTKKRSSEILAVKNVNFLAEKTSFRNLGPRKCFPSPQTRSQVSATGWCVRGLRVEQLTTRSVGLPVAQDHTQNYYRTVSAAAGVGLFEQVNKASYIVNKLFRLIRIVIIIGRRAPFTHFGQSRVSRGRCKPTELRIR